MKNLILIRFVLSSLILLFLTSCTQNSQDASATLKEAVFGFDDANKSKEDILELPFASSYVQVDDGAQIFVVLALAEPSPAAPGQTQLKWLSSDYGMLVTENGRLVKTLRLPADNLSAVYATHHVDPLTLSGQKPEAHYWRANYDWQPDYRYGYTAEIQWRYMSEQKVTSPAWEKQALYYQEVVRFPALQEEFINHFWLDKETNTVIKSIQQLGPDMPAVKITLLKPYRG